MPICLQTDSSITQQLECEEQEVLPHSIFSVPNLELEYRKDTPPPPPSLLCVFGFPNLNLKEKDNPCLPETQFTSVPWTCALRRVDPLIIKSSLRIDDLQPSLAYQQSQTAVSVGKPSWRECKCLGSSITADGDESPWPWLPHLPMSCHPQQPGGCRADAWEWSVPKPIPPPTSPTRLLGELCHAGSFTLGHSVTTIKSYKYQS